MANDVDLDKVYTTAAYKNTTALFDTERFDKFYTLALYGDGTFVPVPVTSPFKYWNGSAWVSKLLKYWNGSAWLTKPIKHWDGSAWV